MRKYCILILLLSVSVILSANFLNKYEPEIIDARASALGGCSILSSQGANYLFNNSSELASLTSNNIQISFKHSSGEKTINYSSLEIDSNMKLKGEYKSSIRLNGLAFTKPLNISDRFISTVGIGWRNYYDMNRIYKTDFTFYQYGNENLISKNKSDQEGGLGTFVLGTGISLTEKIRLGVTYSLPLFNESSNQKIDLLDDQSSANKTEDISYEGSFLTFSGTFDFCKLLSLGVRYHDTFKLLEKVKIKTGTSTQKYDAKYSIPSELGVSLKLTPFKNISLYGEFVSRNLHNYKLQGYLLNGITDPGYELKTGIEYGSKLRIRLGYFARSIPLYKYIDSDDDEHDDTYFWYYQDNPEEEYGFTAGTGIELFNLITADFFVSYSYLSYEDSQYIYYHFGDNHVKTEYEIYRIGATIGCHF